MGAYIVIETNPADNSQTQMLDFPSYRAAALFVTEHCEDSEHVSIWKSLPDGSRVRMTRTGSSW